MSNRKRLAILCAAVLALTGCGSSGTVSEDASGDSGVDGADAVSGADSAAASGGAAADGEELSPEEEESAEQKTDGQGDDSTGLVTPVGLIDVTDQFSERDLDPSYEDRDPVYVTLYGDSAQTDTDDAIVISNAADGAGETVITITAEGVYVFSGTLKDGQIVVECAEDEKVQIVLDSVSLTNDDGPCLFLKTADKVFLTTAEGTENTLSDTGAAYVQPEDYGKTLDGVVFADCDLSIGGYGILTVNAGYANGIVSKKDMKITGGGISVTSEGKGLEANDSIRVAGGTITIDAGDDGLNTDNDEESGKGYIYIEDGSISAVCGDDGIHAATALLITGGSITVTDSYEGLEADTIDITGGVLEITASDDGLNASTGSRGGAGSMGGGSMGGGRGAGDQSAQPDADGDPGTQEEGGDDRGAGGGAGSPEEGTDAPEPGVDGDDAPEAGGGPGMDDGAGPGRPGEGNEGGGGEAAGNEEGGNEETVNADAGNEENVHVMDISDEVSNNRQDMSGSGGMSTTAEAAYIRISGGSIHIDAGGDGIDSNGSLYVEGGEIYVEGPTSSADGAIDYGDGDVEALISGGTFAAFGSSGMAENFEEGSSQYEVMYTFEDTVEAGVSFTMTDSGGNVVMTYTPSKNWRTVVFSSPLLSEGEYTVSAGDQSETITIDGYINQAGSSRGGMNSGSMGGHGGGGGGMPGGGGMSGGGGGGR